jgi:predicted lipoprotein with Yx(FWY)xxD motif
MCFARRCGRWRMVVMLVALSSVGGAFAASNGATVRAVTSGVLRTKIIVGSGGFTLYHLTTEKKGAIRCTGICRKSWPPLLVVGSTKPVAGSGLSASKLGMIKRPDGGVQVTYNGYALYRYGGDKRAGQTNGQGVEGLWYAITPAGAVTKAAAKATPTTPTTTTTPAVSGSSVPTTTASAAPPPPTTTTANGAGVTDIDCPKGQTIPQGNDFGTGASSNDDDDDNSGNPTDGDGCL